MGVTEKRWPKPLTLVALGGEEAVNFAFIGRLEAGSSACGE